MKFYLNTNEAAHALGLRPKTLRKWRQSQRGPGYIKYGNTPSARCFYPVAGIEQWMQKHTHATDS